MKTSMNLRGFLAGVLLMVMLGVAMGVTAPKQVGDRCQSSARWELYTASNSSNFAYLSRAVYVKTAGDVAFVDAEGTVVIWPSVLAGTVLSVEAIRINSTGSTNTGSGEFVVMY